jgi:pyruvate/2-oxoglutarate/acetoin dehydrogenase E1 component
VFHCPHSLTYCQTGTQLYNHLKKAINKGSIQIIVYNPRALFDTVQEEEAQNAHIHKNGTHISLFASGQSIDAANEFAEKYSDIEVIEVISINPLCTKTIALSVQKTGRALLLSTPPNLIHEILDNCFWHLEAQPEHTQNATQSNLARLRARLLET